MTARATFNFHLPLPSDLHEMLREESEQSGQPATTVAREALRNWLLQQKKRRLHEEIASFAAAHAGTSLDLDEDLEQAGIDSIQAEEPS